MFIRDAVIFSYNFATVSHRIFSICDNISGQVLDVLHTVRLNCALYGKGMI